MNVVFVRSFTSDFDARMKKYHRALIGTGSDYTVIGWARGGSDAVSSSRHYLYRRPARLGARWANALGLLLWNFYVFRTLLALRKRIDVIHVVDLDSAIPAYLVSALSGIPLVFDIYDHYADTRNVKGIPRKLLCLLENAIARRASMTLLADECRFAQHGLPRASNISIIENVPEAHWDPDPVEWRAGERLRIGYFGVLEPKVRGLEAALALFRDRDDVELHVAGYGPLADVMTLASEDTLNVFYHGPMDQESGLLMLSKMHCLLGFYYLEVPNHKYAAPNKYYDHLMLGRPLLTTRGTPPGEKVERDHTGWALDDGEEALRIWLNQSVSPDKIRDYGANARRIWLSRFSGYFSRVIENDYISLLDRLVEH